MNAVEVIGDDVDVKQFLVLSQNDVVEGDRLRHRDEIDCLIPLKYHFICGAYAIRPYSFFHVLSIVIAHFPLLVVIYLLFVVIIIAVVRCDWSVGRWLCLPPYSCFRMPQMSYIARCDFVDCPEWDICSFYGARQSRRPYGISWSFVRAKTKRGACRWSDNPSWWMMNSLANSEFFVEWCFHCRDATVTSPFCSDSTSPHATGYAQCGADGGEDGMMMVWMMNFPSFSLCP